MSADRYDLIVIGSGPAGQSAAELAAFLGHSVLIVEQATPGGVVTTTGGAPTKTLREAALAMARESARSHESAAQMFIENVELVRARTLDVCRSLQAGVKRRIEIAGIDYERGSARLTSHGTVIVAGADGTQHEITGHAIVLATGSRPVRFPGVPFEDPDVYDSNDIFSMRRLPGDLVIVGGGPVGVEFATIFTALDVPVTLVDGNDRLLPTMDSELTGVLADELSRRGVTFALSAKVDAVMRRHGRLTMALSTGPSLKTDAVLFAAGRVANTAGLGLVAAGIEVDSRGRIVVDRYFQTTRPGVYAVGDAIGPTLASVAAQHGRAATCHAFGLAFGVPIDRAASAAVYGMPELAGVGATEDEVKRTARAYVVGRCDLARTARGAIAGRGGSLKLIVSADDRKLLGVHCIGDIASELVAMGHAVLHMAGTIDVFLTLALNTPTYTAAYRDAAIDAMAQLAALAGRRPRSVGTSHIDTARTSPADAARTPVSPKPRRRRMVREPESSSLLQTTGAQS
jgi:NAD(P) transhydrogenase